MSARGADGLFVFVAMFVSTIYAYFVGKRIFVVSFAVLGAALGIFYKYDEIIELDQANDIIKDFEVWFWPFFLCIAFYIFAYFFYDRVIEDTKNEMKDLNEKDKH